MLLFEIKGPQSFKDLRIVKEVEYPTY